jgi:hypothetical protein
MCAAHNTQLNLFILLTLNELRKSVIKIVANVQQHFILSLVFYNTEMIFKRKINTVRPQEELRCHKMTKKYNQFWKETTTINISRYSMFAEWTYLDSRTLLRHTNQQE